MTAPLCSTCCKGDGPHVPVRDRLVKTSAKELVEALSVNVETLNDCNRLFPGASVTDELEAFKDHMRSCEYRLSSGRGGLVKDARAAFRKYLRNAAKFAAQRTSKPVQRTFKEAKRKEE